MHLSRLTDFLDLLRDRKVAFDITHDVGSVHVELKVAGSYWTVEFSGESCAEPTAKLVVAPDKPLPLDEFIRRIK